jgi:hypothetical protein
VRTRGWGASPVAALALIGVSLGLFWIANHAFDAGRGDFFYLADAFLRGRTWLDQPLGPADVIPIDGRYYVPFAPFPAVALMPLVALIGPATADRWEPLINATLAAVSTGMCWWLLVRMGVRRALDRAWLVALFGFGTQILWVTTRGGVWHTGHLVATILTFACLVEWAGSRRPWLIGLFAGAAFLTRAPLALAVPAYALLLVVDPAARWHDLRHGDTMETVRRLPWRAWFGLAAGVAPAVLAFFAYNHVRFGTPLESGYSLATLPPFLEAQRERGLFAPVHIPMNLDYFLIHLPALIPEPPFLRPDGLGMSILVTSPGLLLALRADWRRPAVWWLALATILVLIPTLLYYGGGWLQFGYRYFLDSVPFVMALCGLAVLHRDGIGTGWKWSIVASCLVMATSVYWAYELR